MNEHEYKCEYESESGCESAATIEDPSRQHQNNIRTAFWYFPFSIFHSALFFSLLRFLFTLSAQLKGCKFRCDLYANAERGRHWRGCMKFDFILSEGKGTEVFSIFYFGPGAKNCDESQL